MKIKNIEAEIDILIPFHDVDMIGIAWHGNHVKYFEKARTALLQKYNYDYDEMIASNYGWPVIELKARYINVLKYNMRVKVKATLVELEYGIRISYLIYDEKTGKRYCKGHTMQVAYNMLTNEMDLNSPDIAFKCFGLEREV